jgi:hypothetical protein
LSSTFFIFLLERNAATEENAIYREDYEEIAEGLFARSGFSSRLYARPNRICPGEGTVIAGEALKGRAKHLINIEMLKISSFRFLLAMGLLNPFFAARTISLIRLFQQQ